MCNVLRIQFILVLVRYVSSAMRVFMNVYVWMYQQQQQQMLNLFQCWMLTIHHVVRSTVYVHFTLLLHQGLVGPPSICFCFLIYSSLAVRRDLCPSKFPWKMIFYDCLPADVQCKQIIVKFGDSKEDSLLWTQSSLRIDSLVSFSINDILSILMYAPTSKKH